MVVVVVVVVVVATLEAPLLSLGLQSLANAPCVGLASGLASSAAHIADTHDLCRGHLHAVVDGRIP